MKNDIQTQLSILAQTPHGRLVLQHTVGWVVIQSYARPHQAICELAGNTYLSKEHLLDKEQEALIKKHGYTKRRGERTLGKIVPISTKEERETLEKELAYLFPKLYHNAFAEIDSTLYTHIRSGLNNSMFTKTMRALSQKRTHELRLQLYQEFINTTFLLAVDEQNTPLIVEKLANLPCFAVFTDDTSVRCWDPRGTLWKQLYGFEVIAEIMQHNPGSLIINPQGNISGELYKNELQTLYRATQRFSSKRNP